MNVFFLSLLITALTNPNLSDSQQNTVSFSRNSSTLNCQPWLYQFSTFQEGVVVYRNKATRKVLLNYSFLHGKLQFINEHTDTLLLTNKYLIQRVVIADQEFIPGVNDEDNDMEVVKAYTTIRLARLTRLVAKPSSFPDQQFKADPSSVIPSSLLIASKMGEFHWQNTALPSAMRLKTSYYFVDSKGLTYSASLKSIRKVYQKQSAAVRAYSTIHRVDYTNKQHIENFLNYLNAQN